MSKRRPQWQRDLGHGRLRGRSAASQRLASVAGGRPPSENRRSRTGQSPPDGRRARLHRGRRSVAHQRSGHLGAWRLQRQRGLHTYTSYNDFEIVAANLLDNDRRTIADRISAYALYIDPPLGRAGMTERQVRERNRPALVAKRPMTKVGRAVEKGETRGFMKMLVDEPEASTERPTLQLFGGLLSVLF